MMPGAFMMVSRPGAMAMPKRPIDVSVRRRIAAAAIFMTISRAFILTNGKAAAQSEQKHE